MTVAGIPWDKNTVFTVMIKQSGNSITWASRTHEGQVQELRNLLPHHYGEIEKAFGKHPEYPVPSAYMEVYNLRQNEWSTFGTSSPFLEFLRDPNLEGDFESILAVVVEYQLCAMLFHETGKYYYLRGVETCKHTMYLVRRSPFRFQQKEHYFDEVLGLQEIHDPQQ